MKYTRFYMVAVLLLATSTVKANFDFNANCIKAYEQILSLRLNAGKEIIANEKKINPNNSIPYLLDNYVDFFTIMTSENKGEFERLKNNKSMRLNRIERENENSPYYLFALAEINLQWAISRGRFQEYFSSAIEINKAYKMLQENAKKYPSFILNQKNLGMINAMLGSLPEGLKKTMSAFGIHGNTEMGVKMLDNLTKSLPSSEYSFYYEEVVFLLSFVQLDIVNDMGSYNSIIQNTNRIDSSSLLKTYIRSYAGYKLAHNDETIAEIYKRPKGSQYHAYPYLDYLLGMAKMRTLSQDAVMPFNNYLKNYRGVNLEKDTYLSLAYLSLLKGNTKGYQTNIELVKVMGYDYHDRDKQALKEAGYPTPDKDLLKARLLFDGGYYDAALKELADKKSDDFKILRDKIEYTYRLGRIYDAKDRDDVAIKFYQYAITMGSKEQYYFASNAALRIGVIYEKKKDAAKASQYFNTAINMKDHDYENSIENKAKEGLRRLK